MKEAKIAEVLKDKTIENVVYEKDVSMDKEKELRNSGFTSDIIIQFKDGSELKCWNSEWGGIDYHEEAGSEEEVDRYE